MNLAGRAVERLDRFQRRHTATAVPIAVLKKFGDDRGGSMAALVAYYAFFSLFPLLLAATTILGYVAKDSPRLREQLINSPEDETFKLSRKDSISRALVNDWIAQGG